MDHQRFHREEEEDRRRRLRRAEGSDEEQRRRRSWIRDAEIVRSLNAALQDKDFVRGDD